MSSVEELRKQIDAEKEALRIAAEARQEAREEAVLLDELAATKRKRHEEEVLAQMEAKHGLLDKQIARVDTIDGMVLVKRADGVKVRRWQDANSDNATMDSLRELAKPCVIHPEPADFDAMVADRPVVMVAVATAVLKLAGLKLKELGKG